MSVTPTEEGWKLADLPEPRIRFGDGPNQDMPADWAEQFLRLIYAEHPAVFRAILPRLYGLPEPEPKRRRA